MSLFDLTGPEFLTLYGVVLVCAVAAAAYLRWFLRSPGPDLDAEPMKLEPYEIAYLGDPKLAVNAVLANLVQSQSLSFNAADKQFTPGTELSAKASLLEHAVFEAVANASPTRRRIADVHKAIDAGPLVAERLYDGSLILTRGQRMTAILWPALIMLAVLGFGIAKIAIGATRHKPVNVLVLLCVATFVVTIFFVRPPFRSRRGDKVLKQMRTEHEALRLSAKSNAKGLPEDQLILATCLFGAGMLAGSQLDALYMAMRPPPGSSGGYDGSSGGSGCGGGGGGGGGCGGCGGGGGG